MFTGLILHVFMDRFYTTNISFIMTLMHIIISKTMGFSRDLWWRNFVNYNEFPIFLHIILESVFSNLSRIKDPYLIKKMQDLTWRRSNVHSPTRDVVRSWLDSIGITTIPSIFQMMSYQLTKKLKYITITHIITSKMSPDRSQNHYFHDSTYQEWNKLPSDNKRARWARG